MAINKRADEEEILVGVSSEISLLMKSDEQIPLIC